MSATTYPVAFSALPLRPVGDVRGVRPVIVMKPRSVGMSTQNVILTKARQMGMTRLRDEMMKRRELL